jgi:hypothetical protein
LNQPPNKTKRITFMVSGATDALLGGILLLIGFGFLPVDVTQYGVETWHVNLLGAVLLLVGVGTFAYNFSRLDE